MADFSERWMWSDACDVLARVDRIHRQFFQLGRTHERFPVWEPPADVLETPRNVLVVVALPGVAPDKTQVVIEGADLIVSGHRALPPQLATATIHRLELPQGRFERRIPLPPGYYENIERTAADGCLVISLKKAEASHV